DVGVGEPDHRPAARLEKGRAARIVGTLLFGAMRCAVDLDDDLAADVREDASRESVRLSSLCGAWLARAEDCPGRCSAWLVGAGPHPKSALRISTSCFVSLRARTLSLRAPLCGRG